MTQPTDLGCITNIEVVNQFVSVANKKVIDAGCGDMTFSRQLSAAGACVLAIDPDPVQAELNRAEPVPNIEFVEAGADQLPAENKSIDGVFFSYSLHHIPPELYPEVFDEVLRVLRPEGFLYVIEPIDCPLNQVMKLFHNEDAERAAAQQALNRLAIPQFVSSHFATYHSISEYETFEQFANHFSSRSFNTSYTADDVHRREVRHAFEELGGPAHRFQSSKQVMYLAGLLHD